MIHIIEIEKLIEQYELEFARCDRECNTFYKVGKLRVAEFWNGRAQQIRVCIKDLKKIVEVNVVP